VCIFVLICIATCLFLLHCRLNEGHTVFVERKIAGRMLGENVRQMLANDGWTELHGQVRIGSIKLFLFILCQLVVMVKT